jgi:hypothetical protein
VKQVPCAEQVGLVDCAQVQLATAWQVKPLNRFAKLNDCVQVTEQLSPGFNAGQLKFLPQAVRVQALMGAVPQFTTEQV